MEWYRNHYKVSDNQEKMDTDVIFDMLSKSYWAYDRSKEVIVQSMKSSICFGVFEREVQVGFARVITDNIVFSWICDVIIHPDHRGKGLGKWLFQCIMEHPQNQVKTFGLFTKDAHNLYRKFGFSDVQTMQYKSEYSIN
ncbi:GNAT family N-acetyltransferase [Gracilibacillus kekensis]|uniref:Acetyltransferase (GNAT) domain-containing protein n=1 Tax=Gracilibacillus kekensis TaxID=1027249 RepID=A0A1M7Q2X7_9BACI|nr:GNAT family N-acetyltransferase [Gracilibacillus kekensis]SHN24544.1 Acetyltransferase (GNAT) domain-containing protein [Gracilibacillus kekensis]